MYLIVDRVSSGDVAYAAALFMAAAQHRLHIAQRSHPRQRQHCDQVYSNVIELFLKPEAFAECDMTSLHLIFRQFWDASSGFQQQEAVCSRILAFHLFMVRTEGRGVQDWLVPVEDNDEEVILHDAVVHAIGSVPIRQQGGICPVEFASEIRMHARPQ